MKCKRTVWVTKMEKENVLSPLLPWSPCSVSAMQIHPTPQTLLSWFSSGYHSYPTPVPKPTPPLKQTTGLLILNPITQLLKSSL